MWSSTMTVRRRRRVKPLRFHTRAPGAPNCYCGDVESVGSARPETLHNTWPSARSSRRSRFVWVTAISSIFWDEHRDCSGELWPAAALPGSLSRAKCAVWRSAPFPSECSFASFVLSRVPRGVVGSPPGLTPHFLPRGGDLGSILAFRKRAD